MSFRSHSRFLYFVFFAVVLYFVSLPGRGRGGDNPWDTVSYLVLSHSHSGEQHLREIQIEQRWDVSYYLSYYSYQTSTINVAQFSWDRWNMAFPMATIKYFLHIYCFHLSSGIFPSITMALVYIAPCSRLALILIFAILSQPSWSSRGFLYLYLCICPYAFLCVCVFAYLCIRVFAYLSAWQAGPLY